MRTLAAPVTPPLKVAVTAAVPTSVPAKRVAAPGR